MYKIELLSATFIGPADITFSVSLQQTFHWLICFLPRPLAV